jgi:hypothetical protein
LVNFPKLKNQNYVNGHSTRIKKGSGNQLHLTSEQLKKLEQAHAKGRAYTITLNPEQSEKHGQGIFGDIFSKAKKLAVKHKDLINPIISSVKSGASKGVAKLAKSAQDKIDKNIKEIEGEGVKRRRRGRPKKGEGFWALLGPLIKLAAPMVIDAVAGAAKGKVSGMGISEAKARANEMRVAREQARYLNKDHIKVIDGTGAKRKAGRPRKRNGGALYAPGVTG